MRAICSRAKAAKVECQLMHSMTGWNYIWKLTLFASWPREFGERLREGRSSGAVQIGLRVRWVMAVEPLKL